MPETGNPNLMTETASGNPVHKNPKKENLRRGIDTPIRITTPQDCESVPWRARIQGT